MSFRDLSKEKYEGFLKKQTRGTSLFLKIPDLWNLIKSEEDICGYYNDKGKLVGVSIYLHLHPHGNMETWFLPWSLDKSLFDKMSLWLQNKVTSQQNKIEIPVPEGQSHLKEHLKSNGWTYFYTVQSMELCDFNAIKSNKISDLPSVIWQEYREEFFDSYYQTLSSSFQERPGITVPSYKLQKERCKHFGSKLQLLIKNHEVIAFVRVELHADGTGEIVNLACRESERGKGFGNMIVLKGIDLLWNMGAKKIVLEVTLSNDRALKLYERLGFQKIYAMESYVLNKKGN